MHRITASLRRKLNATYKRRPGSSKVWLPNTSPYVAGVSRLPSSLASPCLNEISASYDTSASDTTEKYSKEQTEAKDEGSVPAAVTAELAEPDVDLVGGQRVGLGDVAGGFATDGVSDSAAQTQFSGSSELMTALSAYDPQAQELRDQQYILFDGEDETDYTEGPARMVLATDGVKQECVALLMTLPLSLKIRRALGAQRKFTVTRKKALRKKQALLDLSGEIHGQVLSVESRLLKLRKDEDADQIERDALERELSTLELMSDDNIRLRHELTVDIDQKDRSVRACYEIALAEFQEIYVAAQLMEPCDYDATLPYEDLNLQEEYQKFCQQQHEEDGTFPIPAEPLETDRSYLAAPRRPMTDEEEQRERLKEIYWHRYERLQDAQCTFNNREWNRAEELQANYDAAARNEETTDASEEAFDIRWVKQMQRITHELIEAEAAWAEVKAVAAEAGLDSANGNYDHPEYGSCVAPSDDGYRISMEQELIDSVPTPKIKNWVTDIPDLASPSFNERHDVPDHWDAADVDISDSVSLVAEGEYRKRIEKWRQICGL